MQQTNYSRITTVSAFKKNLALLRLLSFAEKDIEAGRTVSSASLRKGLREWAKSENQAD